MKQEAQPTFDAPIPGMHMTSELGSFPWQQPPQYTTVDEVIEYYTERMSTDEFSEQLIDVLEMGVPVTTLANTIQIGSTVQGIHTIDVGMLVMPILIEMIMLIGDSAKIKYDSGLEKPSSLKTKDAMLNGIREKLNAKDREKTKEPKIKETKKEPKGLMSRRGK
tara:strand:+ start:828 stop:1319 length:492 start_codon:yes stop_codon:yes gene_type:complete